MERQYMDELTYGNSYIRMGEENSKNLNVKRALQNTCVYSLISIKAFWLWFLLDSFGVSEVFHICSI